MPLQPQLLQVPLSTGMDQKADVRALEVTGAVNMQNCVRLKNGAVRKRLGNLQYPRAYASPQNLASGNLRQIFAGGSYKGAPIVSDGGNLYSGSDDGSVTPWTLVDALPEVVAQDQIELFSWSGLVLDVDQVVIGNYLIVVFNGQRFVGDSTQIYYTILNYVTRAVVVPTSAVVFNGDNNYAPKIIALGTTALLTYLDTNSGSILARTLAVGSGAPGAGSPVSASWSAPITLATDVNLVPGLGVYDMAAIVGDATRFALTYPSNSGTNVSLNIYSAAGSLLSQRLTDGTANLNMVSMALYSTSGGQHLVAYSYKINPSGTSKTVALVSFPDPTGSAVTKLSIASELAGRMAVAPVPLSSTGAIVMWSTNPAALGATDSSALMNAFVKGQQCVISVGAWTTTGPLRETSNCLLACRPFFDSTGDFSTAEYCLTYIPSALQGTYVLCAIDWWGNAGSGATVPATLRPVATFAPRLSQNFAFSIGNAFASNHTPRPIALAGASASQWALLTSVNTSPNHVALYGQVIDTQATARLGMSELYELEAVACGMPSYYDGQSVAELGFLSYPEISVSMAGSGGALTAGQYQWCACWEMYDARGQLHQSAPSPPVAATAVSSDEATITSPNLGLTSRRTKFPATLPSLQTPVLVLYRTQANGSIFYRVSPDPGGTSVTFTTGTLTVTDGASDSSIATNELLYTTGGVLPNFCPPSARIVITHKNRWWLAGCPDATQLWPSQELVSGTAPGFSDALNIQASGAIRALASMDDKLVIFVQRGSSFGLEYMTGEGPTSLGTQSDWTPPQPIPSDTGAVDQRSVCVGPFGTLFRGTTGGPLGNGGIFLLTRDLQVQYVSSQVEDLIAQNPVVTSMVLHPNNGRVYITCVPTDSSFSSGVRLVWDYIQGGVWSVDSLTDAGTSTQDCGVRSAFVANCASAGTTLANAPLMPNAYWWCTSSGYIYRETFGTSANDYLDGGAWITMQYQSAWLKPTDSKFARFWRVQIEGDSLDPSDLNMQLTYDFAPSTYYEENYTWTALAQSTFDRFPQIDVQMTCGNQKAKAIQVTLTDAAPTGESPTTGQGPSWAQITLELGVESRKPYMNLPAAQRS